MAQASVMAALAAALSIISVVIPFAGGLSLLTTVPMGLLGYRYRLRVLVAATFAASVVAFLIAGVSGLMVVVNCAYVGGLAGIMKRRGRGTPTVIAVGLVAGVVFGLFIIAALTVLVRLRSLTFSAMTANFDGVVSVVSHFEPFRPAAQDARHLFGVALEYWPLLLMVYAMFSIMVVTLVGWWALSRVLDRLSGIPDVHKLETPDETGPVAPVPVRLVDARFRYPSATHDALRPLSMTVDAGEDVAITGANGSGKTTLMLLLSGPRTDLRLDRAPRRGRTGSAGRDGGHHAASRKSGPGNASRRRRRLGPAAGNADRRRAGCSTRSGLAGMEERDTGGLSGGELQRLAVAAALARQPSMLIADEVTSMVDQRGREALLAVLSGLTERHQMALVQITHYNNEADTADRIVKLSESRGQHPHGRERRRARADGRASRRARLSRCCSSSMSATNTPAAHRGPRPPCTTSASPSTKATAF